VRIAQGEVRWRGPRLRITGPELDDLALQAAADVLVVLRCDRPPGCWPDPQFHVSSPSFLGRPAVTNGPIPGTQRQRPRDEGRSRGPGRDIMHPMFVKLFIEIDADDLPPEEDWPHRARRSRRARPAMVVRTAARGREHDRGRDR